jgi:hypothetical protein
MSNKKLALILVGIFFALILISVASLFVLNSDISKAELGPSPFKVDESVVAENNADFLKLNMIAKEIKGNDQFEKADQLDLKNPDSYILLLQNYLQLNDGIIEKVDLEMIRKLKFPKPDSVNNSDNGVFSVYFKILQRRVELQILTKNFEGAKNDLVLINSINRELIKKPSSLIVGMFVLSNKLRELASIRLLINQDCFTLE